MLIPLPNPSLLETAVGSHRYNSIRVAACLDLSTYLENKHEFPTMLYELTTDLEQWVSTEPNLTSESISGASFSQLRRIHGTIKCNGVNLSYDQIWVRVTYSGYRKAFAQHHSGREGIARHELAGLHADHVINRARLKNIPDAWVVLFPVLGSVNSRFGSAVEKSLEPLMPGVGKASMDPLPAFKLFCESMPKVMSDVPKQMAIVRGQLAFNVNNAQLLNNFLAEMHRQVSACVARPPKRSTVRGVL